MCDPVSPIVCGTFCLKKFSENKNEISNCVILCVQLCVEHFVWKSFQKIKMKFQIVWSCVSNCVRELLSKKFSENKNEISKCVILWVQLCVEHFVLKKKWEKLKWKMHAITESVFRKNCLKKIRKSFLNKKGFCYCSWFFLYKNGTIDLLFFPLGL